MKLQRRMKSMHACLLACLYMLFPIDDTTSQRLLSRFQLALVWWCRLSAPDREGSLLPLFCLVSSSPCRWKPWWRICSTRLSGGTSSRVAGLRCSKQVKRNFDSYASLFAANPLTTCMLSLPFSVTSSFDSDVDYINDRNKHFNKKIERAFGDYTKVWSARHLASAELEASGYQGKPRERNGSVSWPFASWNRFTAAVLGHSCLPAGGCLLKSFHPVLFLLRCQCSLEQGVKIESYESSFKE
eukprot:755782-Hanusia_phi.AAC.4